VRHYSIQISINDVKNKIFEFIPLFICIWVEILTAKKQKSLLEKNDTPTYYLASFLISENKKLPLWHKKICSYRVNNPWRGLCIELCGATHVVCVVNRPEAQCCCIC